MKEDFRGNEIHKAQERRFMRGLKNTRMKLISTWPKRQQLYYIFHLILNQRRFSYSTFLALSYFFRCYNCRNRKSLAKIKSAKQDVFLEKGINKLNKDLDIVNLLETVRN